mmetsp:Transcript_9569/g.18150  ORF Transcript_9569/g.18150 Transcript_9569/m.18150 type:complete len:653 (-) Transcript_9569:329-2287(-)|eukprot:CAMPEP_0175130540 /NCGR_PEP_ID=MMETSP0087-20121206/6061_1 /TAXON_ID=136419 /ORGANISM="Unknown Unknown, Strain D1" /LENGTH=652 /DNA_ID=CAMNT_0016412765 /DNA_START=67 /DNA_END=2025 /DNA_ORIENTATION=+
MDKPGLKYHRKPIFAGKRVQRKKVVPLKVSGKHPPPAYSQFPNIVDYQAQLKHDIGWSELEEKESNIHAYRNHVSPSSRGAFYSSNRTRLTLFKSPTAADRQDTAKKIMLKSQSAPQLRFKQQQQIGAGGQLAPLANRSHALAALTHATPQPQTAVVEYEPNKFAAAKHSLVQLPHKESVPAVVSSLTPSNVTARLKQAKFTREYVKSHALNIPAPSIHRMNRLYIPPADLACATRRQKGFCKILRSQAENGGNPAKRSQNDEEESESEEEDSGSDDEYVGNWYTVPELDKETEKAMFEEDWDNVQLNDCIPEESKREEIKVLLEQEGWYWNIRWCFAMNSLTTPPPEFMNSVEFAGAVRNCKLVDNLINKSYLSRLFVRVNIEEEYDESGAMILVDSEDNPDNMFTRSEFFEAMIRLSLQKWKREKLRPVECVNKLFTEHIVPFTMGADQAVSPSSAFRCALAGSKCQAVISQYRRFIKKLFENFCKSPEPKQLANDEEVKGMALGYVELTAIPKFLQLFSLTFGLKQFLSCIQLSRDENQGDFAHFIGKKSFIEVLCRIGHLLKNKHVNSMNKEPFPVDLPGKYDDLISEKILAEELREFFKDIYSKSEKVLLQDMNVNWKQTNPKPDQHFHAGLLSSLGINIASAIYDI